MTDNQIYQELLELNYSAFEAAYVAFGVPPSELCWLTLDTSGPETLTGKIELVKAILR